MTDESKKLLTFPERKPLTLLDAYTIVDKKSRLNSDKCVNLATLPFPSQARPS